MPGCKRTQQLHSQLMQLQQPVQLLGEARMQLVMHNRAWQGIRAQLMLV